MQLADLSATNRPLRRVLIIAAIACCAITAPSNAQQQIDVIQLLSDIRTLAADEMEGRRAGTLGNRRARAYVLTGFSGYRLEPLNGTYLQTFPVQHQGESFEGANVVGQLVGATDSVIVLGAHYDHLGVREDGAIYNGADDNASGVAALLALADYFTRNPPHHTLLFVAFDAEEMGLQGARAFVQDSPVSLDRIALMVNMDMVSRNEDDELFAVGTYHYPFLRAPLEEVGEHSDIHLLFGHDDPDHPEQEDWTYASDHGPFHEAGIPFVYFGVEDHPGYHDPSDTFENITPAFFIRTVETIRRAVVTFDAELSEIMAREAATH